MSQGLGVQGFRGLGFRVLCVCVCVCVFMFLLGVQVVKAHILRTVRNCIPSEQILQAA